MKEVHYNPNRTFISRVPVCASTAIYLWRHFVLCACVNVLDVPHPLCWMLLIKLYVIKIIQCICSSCFPLEVLLICFNEWLATSVSIMVQISAVCISLMDASVLLLKTNKYKIEH